MHGLWIAGWSSVGLVIGLVPFMLLYWQSLGLVRSWNDVLVYSAFPLDLFHVPAGNLVWSSVLRGLNIAEQPNRNEPEVALGWTPVLALCAGLGFVLFGRVRRAAGPHPWDGAIRPLLAAGAIGPLMSIHFRWFDPWYLVFRFVPGGHSVRTPFRIELAAAFLLCLGLALLAARAAQATRSRVWLAGLLGVLVIEQIGAGPITRDSDEMRRWMNGATRPAAPCAVFYLLSDKRQNWAEYQSDAMLLSQVIALPTINGNASFFPPGWNLGFTDPPRYAATALAWIDGHGLREQACGIEPRVGRWIQGVQPLLDSASRAAGR